VTWDLNTEWAVKRNSQTGIRNALSARRYRLANISNRLTNAASINPYNMIVEIETHLARRI